MKEWDIASDVWALGVTFWELAARRKNRVEDPFTNPDVNPVSPTVTTRARQKLVCQKSFYCR